MILTLDVTHCLRRRLRYTDLDRRRWTSLRTALKSFIINEGQTDDGIQSVLAWKSTGKRLRRSAAERFYRKEGDMVPIRYVLWRDDVE